MASNRQQQRREPWRNQERHHCPICNSWMGSDRQSIMLHENGKKHQDNVEKELLKKRKEKQKEDKMQSFIESSLAQMEQTATLSHLQKDGNLLSSQLLQPTPSLATIPVRSQSAPPPPPPPASSRPNNQSSKKEKQEWQARKLKRKAEKSKNKEDENNDDSGDNKKGIAKRQRIEPGQGHYDYHGKTYLEGQTFFGILEPDMPVQLWTGPLEASWQEKRLVERGFHWKDALVVGLRTTDPPKCHVAYLASPDDSDETVEKNVSVDRIRIILGADDSIPDSLEEARLLAMGGEEIKVEQPTEEQQKIDDATGLTGWSTVTVKRTTVRQETKEERARLREKREQELVTKAAQEKEAYYRRMEEAKVANAGDSALGAYDSLNQAGYKGIDITKDDTNISVADTAKRLATGNVSVAFKSKKVKRRDNARNRRKTCADDDD